MHLAGDDITPVGACQVGRQAHRRIAPPVPRHERQTLSRKEMQGCSGHDGENGAERIEARVRHDVIRRRAFNVKRQKVMWLIP